MLSCKTEGYFITFFKVTLSSICKEFYSLLTFIILISVDRKYFDNFMRMLNVQVEEMKSIGDAVKKLKTGRGSSPPVMKPIDAPQFTTENSMLAYLNLFIPFVPLFSAILFLLSMAERSVSPPSSVDSDAPPHPKSYMDVCSF